MQHTTFPWLLTLLVLIAVPLSGCTSAPDPIGSSQDPVDDQRDPAAGVALNETLWRNETYEGLITGVGAGITIGNMYLCCVSVHQEGDGITSEFSVAHNATRILVELIWEHETFDLDLLVAAPGYEFYLPPTFDPSGPNFRDSRGFSVYSGSGTLGQPDHPVRVEIDDLEALALAGGWTWEVRSKTAHEVAFHVIVSVAYGPQDLA